jgi:hypothetical protein
MQLPQPLERLSDLRKIVCTGFSDYHPSPSIQVADDDVLCGVLAAPSDLRRGSEERGRLRNVQGESWATRACLLRSSVKPKTRHMEVACGLQQEYSRTWREQFI